MEKQKIKDMISSEISASIETKKNIDLDKVMDAAELIISCIKSSGKILICGNGGSAADAQHFAGEMIGRFKIERKGLPCIALTTDTSILSCIGNDYGFEHVFSRQIEAMGSPGDVIIGISTSGNSKNVIMAIDKAKEKKIKTISLLNKNGGKMKGMSDVDILVPSCDTPRVQESHIMILHILAGLVDEALFR